MITVIETETDNQETTGFEVTTPSPLTIVVSEGSYKGTGELETYSAFTFDVEPDPDFPISYDIYLLESGMVSIDRTVLLDGVVPNYGGEGILIHTLTSFIVPAGTEDLSEINIKVRKVVATHAENTGELEGTDAGGTEEVPTEEAT